ncbi:UvrB/UvrC motif-containing protein [bacterium]|nr:UvrB/UvrC motif-containing protein [bacterium]
MSLYQKKKCMKCGKPATHKFTRIQDGQIYDLYLCGDHAAEMSPYQKPKQIALSDILEGMLKQDFSKIVGGPGAPAGVVCKNCGLSFEDYRKNLLLGCSECYDSFHDYLVADLRRFHGDTRHVGRRPGGKPAQPAPPAPVGPFEDVAERVEAEPEPPSPTKGAENLIANPERAIEELTRAMKSAIATEDYERAAKCRDQIRELRQKMK